MCALEVRSLSKTIAGNRVIDDVSFRIEDGEFLVLVGPSGSGKSTLLKLITGLERPDHGSVLIDGKDVTTLSPQARNLGMVFQDYGLYPNMTIAQNIAFGLEARGLPRAEIDKRTRDAAQMLGLGAMLQ